MLITIPVCTSEKQFNRMTDSMKFGPEWLRNLSSEGNSSTNSGGGTRYHLAEHRYGREEMLALFEQSLKIRPPASMTSHSIIYVEQPLNPLALAPMTEDENRLWSGRTVPPGAPRGRGGSMDRGRGRGRGGTYQLGFTRSTSSYDEPVRSYDRSQSERGWSERNGDMASDWSGSSPRKEYASSRGSLTDNWRRHRTEEEDGWRTTNHRNSQDKWGRTSNWREGDQREEERGGHLSDRQTSNRVSWHSSGDSNRGPPHRRPWDVDDHLPEWATENPSESGGTFDASGAFHGSDEESHEKNNASRSKPKETTLQKSASQQNISSPKKPAPLMTSQSALNLTKKTEEPPREEKKGKSEEKSSPSPEVKKEQRENKIQQEKNIPVERNQQKHQKEVKKEENHETVEKERNIQSNGLNEFKHTPPSTKVDDEFDHMKEVTDDIVAKLILDDDTPKNNSNDQQQSRTSGSQIPGYGQVPAGLSAVLGAGAGPAMPPPGTVGQDKWYYRDPQGEVQGPFSAQEMAEWFRAGYFSVSLLVRRHCDERYFTLGELVKQCAGGVPFLNCRLPPLKSEPVGLAKIPDQDPILQHHLHVQRLLQRQADAIRVLSQTEPWAALSHLQQRELVTQHMLAQPNIISDIPYVPQIPNTQITNPLIHMINQMQQANKLPTQPTVVEKPPSSVQSQHLDPLQQLVQQMGGLQSNLGANLPPMTQNTQIENSSQQNDNDPIKSLLRQLAKQQPMDTMWSQSNYPQQPQVQQQWMGAQPNMPSSLWDIHQPPVVPPPVPTPPSVSTAHVQPSVSLPNPPTSMSAPVQTSAQENAAKEQRDQEAFRKAELEKEQKQRDRKEAAEKERKKKELEQQEKLKAQKEAEEKRKEEQRKKEAEKKVELERQRKEEERIKRELEKAKKEAEEKRLRELEEKRKLKEQRKAEEEAKKKAEEDKKKEEEEKQSRREIEKKEDQAKRQAEALRKMQESQQQQAQRASKVAPWGQSSSTTSIGGTSLAEIQRLEKEKRAEQAALLQQQRALQAVRESQEQQVAAEKSAMQLKWAVKKTPPPKKIKSLAEIQAEEQERLAKQVAEARMAQQQKEKEVTVPAPSVGIWGSASQSLTWSSNQQQQLQQQQQQWGGGQNSGFWDDSPTVQKSPVKPTIVVKSNSTAVTTSTQPQSKPSNKNTGRSKAKKEEAQVMKLFDKNGPSNAEFTMWCIKTMSTLTTDVDIPTFVGFLRDIESPYEVKDYVRQYLGDSAQAAHFANQFVERRSRVRERQRAALQHKDDLCTPAPAINPSNADFQEVKGKGKKTKKSKMTKLDNRALGFNVIAAEDRINVGDRDYGDNIMLQISDSTFV